MGKKIKGLLKNSKGFTLVELLAVIVILGIIAGIAIPSIGGIIDNSKKDAHVSNGLQVISAAKLMLASDPSLTPIDGKATILPLKEIIAKGYLETPISPDTKNKYTSNTDFASSTHVNAAITITLTDSYVRIINTSGVFEYSVFLEGGTGSKDLGTASDPVTQEELQGSTNDTRDKVTG